MLEAESLIIRKLHQRSKRVMIFGVLDLVPAQVDECWKVLLNIQVATFEEIADCDFIIFPRLEQNSREK